MKYYLITTGRRTSSGTIIFFTNLVNDLPQFYLDMEKGDWIHYSMTLTAAEAKTFK